MSTSNSGTVSLDIQGRTSVTAGVVAGALASRFMADLNLGNGTADGSIDLIYSKGEVGIAASSTTSYDLSGALSDPGGAACVFAEVVMIAFRNNRTTALATLNLGPHATNGFGRLASGRGFWPADVGADGDQGSIAHPNAGWITMYAPDGVPVVAGTGDILRVIASAVAGDINAWDLLIFGRSA